MTVVRASTSASGTGNSLTLTIPAGTQGQDVMILFAASGYTPTASLAGWTLLKNGGSTGNYSQYSVFSRVAAGAAGGASDDAGDDVVVGMSGSYDCFAALVVMTGTPVFTGLSVGTAADTNTVTNTYTSDDADDLLLHFGWFRSNQASTTLSCDPGTEIEQATTTNAGGVVASETGGAGAGVTCTYLGNNSGTGQDGMSTVTVGFSAEQIGTWMQAVLADSPTYAYQGAERFGLVLFDYAGGKHGKFDYASTTAQGAGTSKFPGTPTHCARFTGTSSDCLATSALPVNSATTTVEFLGCAERTDPLSGLWIISTSAAVYLGAANYRWGQIRSTTRGVNIVTDSYDEDIIIGVPFIVAETTNGTTKYIYRNGVEAISVAASGTVATGDTYYGRYNTAGTELYGTISGVAIWVGTALTEAQIAAHTTAAACIFTDGFADAVAMNTDMGASHVFDTTGWTTEGSEPGLMSHTGWVKLIPELSGRVALSTVGSDHDTKIAVYTGTEIDDLTLVGSDDDSGGSGTSLLEVDLEAGTTYHVQVGSQPAGSGGDLTFSCTRVSYVGHIYKGRATKAEDTAGVA